MRKSITCLVSLCLFCFSISLPAAADIFMDSEPGNTIASGAPPTLPPMNPDRVLRQRAVEIDWDEVAANLAHGLRLNLFDDVTLEMRCETLVAGPQGDQTCLGSVVGETPGQVTMVVGDNSLAATIGTPEMTYKVRPIDGNWHVVREIRPDAGGSSIMAAAATDDERMVWTLTNQERADHGLHELSLNGDLVASARAHSADMAAQNYFDHTSLDGRSPGDRIAAAGYEAWGWGENIAAGYSSPQAVVEGWMNSPGHKANILRDSFCDLGVGYASHDGSQWKRYWTQNFGRQAGVSVCPAASDDAGGGNDGGGNDGGGGDDGGGGNDGGVSDGDSGGGGGSSSSDGGCFVTSSRFQPPANG